MISALLAVSLLNCTTVQTIGPDKYGHTITGEVYACAQLSGTYYLRKSDIKTLESRFDERNQACYCRIARYSDEFKLDVAGNCEQVAKQVKK